jgi:hypothetical protein
MPPCGGESLFFEEDQNAVGGEVVADAAELIACADEGADFNQVEVIDFERGGRGHRGRYVERGA